MSINSISIEKNKVIKIKSICAIFLMLNFQIQLYTTYIYIVMKGVLIKITIARVCLEKILFITLLLFSVKKYCFIL